MRPEMRGTVDKGGRTVDNQSATVDKRGALGGIPAGSPSRVDVVHRSSGAGRVVERPVVDRAHALTAGSSTAPSASRRTATHGSSTVSTP